MRVYVHFNKYGVCAYVFRTQHPFTDTGAKVEGIPVDVMDEQEATELVGKRRSDIVLADMMNEETHGGE